MRPFGGIQVGTGSGRSLREKNTSIGIPWLTEDLGFKAFPGPNESDVASILILVAGRWSPF